MTTILPQVTYWLPTGYGKIRLSGISVEGHFWADLQTSWDGLHWAAEVLDTNYKGNRDDLIASALDVAFN